MEVTRIGVEASLYNMELLVDRVGCVETEVPGKRLVMLITKTYTKVIID